MNKEDIVKYFKELSDKNNSEDVLEAPTDCKCNWKNECRECGAQCLCDIIAHPNG